MLALHQLGEAGGGKERILGEEQTWELEVEVV